MILTAALMIVAQTEVTDEWERRMTGPARAVMSCRAGADCDSIRSRARQWIVDHSRYSIVSESDDLIITRGPAYASNDSAFAVVFSPVRSGTRDVRFRAWCGNWIACFPSTEEWRRRFIRAMRTRH